MTHAELVKQLFENQDLKYKAFHTALVPNVSPDTFIGVRVPVLRKLAKEFFKSGQSSSVQPNSAKKSAQLAKFFDKLPHRYFEENQIHLMMVTMIKDYGECLARTEQFLPYIDNWAVCDGKTPKALLKNIPQFLAKIQEWLRSEHPYVVRFAINMLMDQFLEDRFNPRFLKWVAAVDINRFKEKYYVQMEVAWYFATALAKQWEAAVPFIESRKLEPWTHNKAIQKSIESYRVSDEHKAYLRTLKF